MNSNKFMISQVDWNLNVHILVKWNHDEVKLYKFMARFKVSKMHSHIYVCVCLPMFEFMLYRKTFFYIKLENNL